MFVVVVDDVKKRNYDGKNLEEEEDWVHDYY